MNLSTNADMATSARKSLTFYDNLDSERNRINRPVAAVVPRLPVPVPSGGEFDGSTLLYFEPQGGMLAAAGALLFRYDGSGKKQLELPPELKHPIRTIAEDNAAIWLGTEGGGLWRISRSGEPPRTYDEKDGLLMPSILSSRLIGNRLYLGFGFQESGGFGYLDTATGKFVGLTAELSLFKSSPKSSVKGPPDSAVSVIIMTDDEKTLWLASRHAVHCFDTEKQTWRPPLAVAPISLSVNSKYVAVGVATGGVMVCEMPGGKWNKIDFSPDWPDNQADVIRADGADPRLLWISGGRKIRLIDMATAKVMGACEIPGGYFRTRTIFVTRDQIFFFLEDPGYNACREFSVDRPVYDTATGTLSHSP
jgi:hypothetical protein